MKKLVSMMITGFLGVAILFAQAPALNKVTAPPAKLHDQSFDAIYNPEGEAYLMMNLLLSLERGTNKIVIAQSFNGKDWEDIKEIEVESLRSGDSYTNLPLSVSIDKIENIVKESKGKVYFSTYYYINDTKFKLANDIIISKQEVKNLTNF